MLIKKLRWLPQLTLNDYNSAILKFIALPFVVEWLRMITIKLTANANYTIAII